MKLSERLELIMPVRRPVSGAAWKRIRGEVLEAVSFWLSRSEEVFAAQERRILELEGLCTCKDVIIGEK